MPDLNRVVAGLRCVEVLDLLSDHLDGDLSLEMRARVEDHLAGCDHCERFGGRMAAVVESLRRRLAVPEGLDPGVQAVLARRLQREWDDLK